MIRLYHLIQLGIAFNKKVKMNNKKCITCKKSKPKTKEYWRFDKRRVEPYGSCIDCINKKRRVTRHVKRISDYDTDLGIEKRVKSKNLQKDMIEVERAKLILKDRIKNTEHLVFNENKMTCKICKHDTILLLPISFKLLKKAMEGFKILHKHDRKFYKY